VIILNADDIEGAHSAFERLRENIALYKFPRLGKVTVSIGLVEIILEIIIYSTGSYIKKQVIKESEEPTLF